MPLSELSGFGERVGRGRRQEMTMRLIFGMAVLAVAAASQAQIANASFEADVVGFQNLNTIVPTGWSYGGSIGAGSWDTRGSNNDGWMPFYSAAVPNGNQIAYFNEGPLAQQTGFTLLPGVSTLTVAIGNRGDGATNLPSGPISGTFTMELWAGGTVVNGNVLGGSLLATRTINSLTYTAPTTYADASLDFNALGTDPRLGQLISIRFGYVSGHQFNIDNVRFVEAVPEPMTLTVLGAGVLALVRRKRARG